MDNDINAFCEALLEETRRRLFNESFPRLKQCLNTLTEQEIWTKPNVNSNSVGNLSLHLCGNARQWIISGLGGTVDERLRQKEFDEKGPIPVSQLIELINQLEHDIEEVLQKFGPADLLKKRKVQTFQETGLSILVHVIEHFSYHVGQITYYVKLRKDIDTGYYKNMTLE
ncbi:MAG: DUF1572 domain-containing protein [Chitinophagales bacterium]|nr:DUF1572 domain-containing protein [Chitinophagales bacterium]